MWIWEEWFTTFYGIKAIFCVPLLFDFENTATDILKRCLQFDVYLQLVPFPLSMKGIKINATVLKLFTADLVMRRQIQPN